MTKLSPISIVNSYLKVNIIILEDINFYIAKGTQTLCLFNQGIALLITLSLQMEYAASHTPGDLSTNPKSRFHILLSTLSVYCHNYYIVVKVRSR